MPVKLYLWKLNSELHIILCIIKYYSSLDFFFQPIKNVKKTFSNLSEHQNHLEGLLTPTAGPITEFLFPQFRDQALAFAILASSQVMLTLPMWAPCFQHRWARKGWFHRVVIHVVPSAGNSPWFGPNYAHSLSSV